jgi:hypothetical protein
MHDHHDSSVRANISSSVSPGPLEFAPFSEMEIGNVFSMVTRRPIDPPFQADPPGQPEKKKRTFGLIPWADITPTGQVLTLVKHVLAPGSLAMIYGPSGVGKSFFTLDLAIHIAMAREWRGKPVAGGGVCYIAAEGAHGMRQRVEAVRRDLAVPDDTPFYMLPSSMALTGTPEDADALIAAVKAIPDLRLVVFDTVHRTFGGGDENSAQDVGQYIGALDRIREATGACALMVHHTGKDESKGARGSYAFKADVDTEISITIDEDGTAVAAIQKQKDGPEGERFTFRRRDVDLGLDDEGEAITVPVVEHIMGDVPAPTKGKVGKLNDRQALAMRALNNHFAGTDRDTIDFGTFKTILVHRGVLEEGANPALFTRLRQQLERLGKIYFNGGQIGLTKSGQKL